MPNFPSISIVIATYNGERYLREQLDSIAAQTLKPTQIIIQDDASSDATVAIIKEYPHLPIELEINPHNLGYIRNFELALSKASGDYIALCDQDDIWETNKLDHLLKAVGVHSLVYSNSLLIDSKGNSLGKTLSDKLKNRFISTHSPLAFIYDNCVSAHALLFHQSLLPQLFPFPKHLYFDAWIAANAASLHGVCYLDETLVHYRQHSTNTLSITDKEKHPMGEKVSLKTLKKIEEHTNRVKIISDLLTIQTLNVNDKKDLIQLCAAHQNFHSRWFNINFLNLLLKRKSDLFAITKRSPWILALKKAIGLKLYCLFPFL
jgi:glycosyltransferase involved in cell wall biosynthesis